MKGAIVDEVTCIGCGLCVQLCPKVFAMQDSGKSKAICPACDEEGTIQGSIDSCPVTAISWKEYSDEEAKPEGTSEEAPETATESLSEAGTLPESTEPAATEEGGESEEKAA